MIRNAMVLNIYISLELSVKLNASVTCVFEANGICLSGYL